MKNNDYGFDTLQVHGGQSVDKDTMSRSVPIYQTTSYLFKDTNHAKRLFDLEQEGNIYTRIMNPTTDVLEKRMALLEKGKGALAVASGTSAILYSILNIAKSGDEIISSSKLYGGTYNLFSNTFKKFGIKTKFFDPDEPEKIRKLVTNKTKAIYYETLGNPSINIPDFEKITKIANEKGVITIVDNTFATPYLFRPIEYGANIVVHSATKYIGGHGTSIGGVVIDSGEFDFKNSKRYSEMNKPDEGYHGVVYTDQFKELAYIVKMRTTLLRDTGACISPFNSFLLLLGLETLSLRMEKHIKNASEIVKYLSSNPYISWINYPGLESDKYSQLAKKYLPKGVGGIFTFGIKGGYDNAVKFIEKLKLFSHLANVADAKSLVIHPSSTTHAQLTKEKQKMAGITSDMIRVSVGIEDAKDLIKDIENSLKEVMRK